MTKLTTERLEEIAKLEITEFSNGMDIAKDAYQSVGSSEIVLMARQLLAYEQAAEHPAARITWDGSEFSVSNVSEDFLYGGTAVYLAPVLPKQPELVENLKKVMNSWLAMEPKLAYQPEFTDVMMLLDAEAAPAQPVIPEQAKPEFYTKPDRFLPECLKPEDISGESRNSRIAELMGWFDRYYNGKANPKWLKPHVAELCYYILTVPQLSAQPVSEPYKLPSGWKLVPIEPTAAMFHAFNDDDYGRKSMRERYIQMIEAAPAQESE